jgi:hypothetical protein
MRRRKFYRTVFTCAGIYNIVWGLYTIASPQWFFKFAGLPPINHPAIFACLGMVIGLYGLLLLHVGKKPEGKSEIVIVGLTGKVFGPIGMAYLIGAGAWPLKAGLLCVTNDLIWWIPFAMYLIDARAEST